MNLPRPGEVYFVGPGASVQFAPRPINFRVIRVVPRPTYDGWIWLDGYELGPSGDAVERREIWVKVGGLRRVWDRSPPPRARNRGPASGRQPAPGPSRSPSSPSTPTPRTHS
jgi:hypothetical protein